MDAGEPAPDESHFFVAVCAHRPQIGNPTFVYVPRAANVLRERERHIALLEHELADQERVAATRRSAEPRSSDARSSRRSRQELEEEQPLGGGAEPRDRRAPARIARAAGGDGARAGGCAANGGGLRSQGRGAGGRTSRAKTKWARDVETRLTAEVRSRRPTWWRRWTRCTRRRRSWRSAPPGRSAWRRRRAQLDAAARAGARVALDEAGPQGRTRARSCRPVDMAFLKRFLTAPAAAAALAAVLMAISFALALTDLLWKLFGRRGPRPRRDALPRPAARSVVIPNWNGTGPAGEVSTRRCIAGNGAATRSSWWTTAPPTAAPSFVRAALPARDGAGAAGEPGLRRRLERRLPRGEERHRRAAEQRHARGAAIFSRRCSKASPIPRSSPSPARSSSAIRTSSAKRPA